MDKLQFLVLIVYNYDADLEVSDTCVRSSLLSWVIVKTASSRNSLFVAVSTSVVRFVCVFVFLMCKFNLPESSVVWYLQLIRDKQSVEKCRQKAGRVRRCLDIRTKRSRRRFVSATSPLPKVLGRFGCLSLSVLFANCELVLCRIAVCCLLFTLDKCFSHVQTADQLLSVKSPSPACCLGTVKMTLTRFSSSDLRIFLTRRLGIPDAW